MSYVTDLVVITNWPREADTAAKIFCDAFEKDQGYRPEPVGSGSKVTGLNVFHIGVNYMGVDLRNWILSYEWPAGCVVYLEGEDDTGPTIVVGATTVVKGELYLGP